MCNGHSWCAGSIYTHYRGTMAKTMKKICFPVTVSKFFILQTGDLLMTTSRSLHSTLIFIYHYNTTTLLHWTQIYLFHTYLSMISSSLRHHFYQIWQACLTQTNVVQQGNLSVPKLQKPDICKDFSPRALSGCYAPCLLPHLKPFQASPSIFSTRF